jgi:hypothetical protein
VALVDHELVLEALKFEGHHASGKLVKLFTESAESIIAGATGRNFLAADGDPVSMKTIRAAGDQWIRVPDLRDPTSVVVDGLTVTLDEDYTLEPDPLFGEPATFIALLEPPLRLRGQVSGLVQVTGKWGFATCPPDVQQAVIVLAARFYKERDAGFADQLIGPEGIAANYFRQLPAFVQQVVDRYRVRSFAIVGM